MTLDNESVLIDILALRAAVLSLVDIDMLISTLPLPVDGEILSQLASELALQFWFDNMLTNAVFSDAVTVIEVGLTVKLGLFFRARLLNFLLRSLHSLLKS